MLKAFQYRLRPNAKHRDAFAQHFGCVRKVYNLFLGEQKEAYETEQTSWNFYEYKRKLPTLKQELLYLKDVNSQSLQAYFKRSVGAIPTFPRIQSASRW